MDDFMKSIFTPVTWFGPDRTKWCYRGIYNGVDIEIEDVIPVAITRTSLGFYVWFADSRSANGYTKLFYYADASYVRQLIEAIRKRKYPETRKPNSYRIHDGLCPAGF